MPHVRGLGGHRGGQSSPELGLPQEVGVERLAGTVGVATRGPVGDQARPLHGVRREEAGEPTGDGVAPPHPEVGLCGRQAVAEVTGQGGGPGLVEGGVDGGEQRPDQGVG